MTTFGCSLMLLQEQSLQKQSCFVPLQSNLSNPPTPPSSLPPTPPPSVQHKLLNGVTPVEELSEVQKDTEPAEPMGKQ